MLKDGTKEDFSDAAIRHFHDARTLRENCRLDNAGHLIGFAAECAIKYKLDAFTGTEQNLILHLPELLPAARKRLVDRGNYSNMYNILKAGILADWSVDWRYSSTGKTTADHLDDWFNCTRRLFAAAHIKVRMP